MAHPMDSQQFREAAKAAIDDSKFLCFCGVVALQVFNFLSPFCLKAFPSPSHQQSRISIIDMNTFAKLQIGCSELHLVLT
jgi:hypothetical protein